MEQQQHTLMAFDNSRLDADALEFGIVPSPTCFRQHRYYGDALLDSLPKTSIQAVQYGGNNFCGIQDFMTARARHCVVGVPRYDEDCLTVNATGAQLRLYVGEFLVHGEDFYIDTAEALQLLQSSTQYCDDQRKSTHAHDDAMAEVVDSLTSCIHWARYHHNRPARVRVLGEEYYVLLVRAICALLGCENNYKDSKVAPDIIVTCHELDCQWPDNVIRSVPEDIFNQAAKPMLVNMAIPKLNNKKRRGILHFMRAVGLEAK